MNKPLIHYCGLTENLTHDLPMDPTYGMNLEQLLNMTAPEEPEDFQSFWQNTFSENEKIDPCPVIEQEFIDGHHLVSIISYSSCDNFTTRG